MSKTIKVMGEEDIETEIEQEDRKRQKAGEPLRTIAENDAYRAKRKIDIKNAIQEAKKYEDLVG